MNAERNSLSEPFQDGRRSLRSLFSLKPAIPSERSRERDSLARPLIPAGPAAALAMAPMQRRGGVA
jgi:hypothetical protein